MLLRPLIFLLVLSSVVEADPPEDWPLTLCGQTRFVRSGTGPYTWTEPFVMRWNDDYFGYLDSSIDQVFPLVDDGLGDGRYVLTGWDGVVICDSSSIVGACSTTLSPYVFSFTGVGFDAEITWGSDLVAWFQGFVCSVFLGPILWLLAGLVGMFRASAAGFSN